MRICRLILSALIATLAAPTLTAEMTLVQEGRPTCAIVVATNATPPAKLAAEDLQTYLRKMSGASVSIATNPSTATNRILIGVFGQAPVQDWQGASPQRDAFAIETRSREGGTDLYLVGGDERGASYAVYELLERFLGVRWYMPGELGEEVPARATITLQELKWANRPDYEAVSGLTWHGGPGAKDWLRRNKGDVGSPTYFFGHSWSGYINPSEENKKAHPEWFALNKDGTRSEQLCTSHPEVLQKFIEVLNQYFDKQPEAVLASISPNDGHGFCTCERCQAIDAQYGVTDGTQTDRFIHFANAILKEVKKKHPDKLLGVLAYVSHTRPPVSAVPDANYATTICHTPWDFCHVHSIDDPNCKSNARFRQMIEGWTKVCKHVSVYDYYGHYYYMTPWPLVHSIRKDLPYLRKIGVTGFISETQQHWANQGLNFYVAAKLVWDTDLDTEAVLNDFYRKFYGPAEKPMRAYWESWEMDMSKQNCGGAWLQMFTPELLKSAGQLLEEAEQLAEANEKVQRRLHLHRIGYNFTLAYIRMVHHGRGQELEQAVAAGEEAVRIIEASAGTEPQAFHIRLASDQTGIQMLSHLKKLKAKDPSRTRVPGEVLINPKDGVEMVYVPAGEFQMGQKEGQGSADARPVHTTYLDEYWIYKYPVTVAQYRKFCEATGRPVSAMHHMAKEDHPVVNVSWEDANAYAQWAGAVLPTEAQWEKAARGPDGRIFPWGDYPDSVKRRTATLNDEEQTKPVGEHPEVSSPYGVEDMTGNVWQWCADWYDPHYYQNAPARNPVGPAEGKAKVLRGGRWFINQPNFFPAAFRNSCDPKHWIGFTGFRCAMAAPPK